MQEPFFFAKRGRQLFAVFYPPEGERSGKGIVLCGAFGKEYNLCLSILANFARLLARRGHAVLRFDYTGYADSEGGFEDATISEMSDDIECAIAELTRKAEVNELGLMGVRFGATLAALVAGRRPDIKRLLLWEPTPEPWAYLYAELRHTVTMQTVLFREVRVTREEIVKNVLAGQPSLVEGYDFNCIDEGFPLAAELVQQAKEISLIAAPPAVGARVMVVHVSKQGGPVPKRLNELVASFQNHGIDCVLEAVIEPCIFWTYDAQYVTRSEALFNASASFFERD